MSVDADIIIVGAGAAGLAAAIELQSTNLTFLIVEARNRIGGRAYTDQETFTPSPIDLGASWIHSYGPDNVLYDYHQSFNVNQNKNKMVGDRLQLDYDGQPFESGAIFQARTICSKIYRQLELYTYNKHDKKHTEDQSIEQVMQSEYERLVPTDGPVKRLVDLYMSGEEQFDGSSLTHLSAKYWETGAGSGCDHWVTYGYGSLIEQIAKKHNLSIRLNTLVTQINTTDPDRIAVTISNDSSSILYCRRIIITIPLGCLKRETILFEPPLPDWKREAINKMGLGLMNKLILQFSNDFWGPDVRGILHACNERRGRFRLTICIPPPENILILFVTGTFALELEQLTDAQTLEQIMKFLRQIFPKQTIPDPIKYKFTRWAQDPLAYGAYSNFAVHTGPHTIEQLAKETSNGRVQWAGEHANIDDGTEDWAYACVHSAFQSGQRAARTIRDQLCSS
jgi:monoamine oxidase